MTAELGITNGYGVVLAADSSLTMQDHSSRKYYITGQKIFKLSSKHSVAIMFYGNATINGQKIQSIVEGFNQYLGEEPLNKFTEYVHLFKEYLIKSANREYEQYIKQKLEDILNNLHSTYKTQDLLGNLIEVKKEIQEEKIPYTFQEFQKFMNQDRMSQFLISEDNKYTTEELEYAYYMLVSQTVSNFYTTGIVLAGKGKEENYCSLWNSELYGVLDSKIFSIKEISSSPNYSNLYKFAQSDGADALLLGVDRKVSDAFYNNLYIKYQGTDTIEITKAFQRTVDDYYNKFYRAYINGLTLDKVANFAKQLVLATMIRRNFFDNNQTVGGSIDVLTIASNGKVSWVQKGKNVRDIELKVTSEERTIHNLKKPRISDEPELTFEEWIEKQISLAEKVVNREEKQDDEDSKDEISFKEWINQQIKSAEEIVKRNE